MTSLFQATEYLHTNGVCHRDLKPDNIMVTKVSSSTNRQETIKVKIIDLNVAVETDPDSPQIKGATGVREWSAPETRKSTLSGFKIDCWTLGCVMYLLCTGK